MAQPTNHEADPAEVKNAKDMWLSFTSLMKYSCVGVAAVLVMMLVFIY